jgi:tetratricopeptide (TPR) repeat protein
VTAGHTARGTLWREDDRVVRVIDPRLCDEVFRGELARLRSGRHPRTLDVVRDGPAEDGYRIEYALPGRCRSLDEELAARTRWPGRLELLIALCDSVDIWHTSRMSSIGLDPHSVVFTGDGGDPVAWLAPCPPVRLGTPRDLFGVDEGSLAVVAPEVVRGLSPLGPPEDAYALGTLAARALGCGVGPWAGPDGRVEAQARGALIDTDPQRSLAEPFLRRLGRIETLFATIRRYRDPVPDARPAGTRDLRRAITAALDVAGLAQDLRRSDPAAALTVLGWDEARSPDERISRHRLAAEIAAEAGDPETALDHLDRAVELIPAHVQVREERGEQLWRWWCDRAEDRDRIGPRLLEDLAFLQPRGHRAGAALWWREAVVHRHAKKPRAALRALFEAEKRDAADLMILLESARCWRELDKAESDENVRAIRALARRRIPTLVAAGNLPEKEVKGWLDAFDAV